MRIQSARLAAMRAAVTAVAGGLLVGIGVGVSVAACDDGASDATTTAPTSADGGTSARWIRFDVPGPLLVLDPSTTRTIGVAVTGDVGSVELALDGAYEDAALGTGELTPVAGRGEFKLYASTIPSAFVLRARAQGLPEARVSVKVTSQGFATLRVTPRYRGNRPAPSFFASVVANTSCREISRPASTDGPRIDTGAPGASITFAGVPSSGRVAVLARIEHYAAGCTDLEAVVAGALHEVPVEVNDLPLTLAGVTFAVAFDLAPDAADRAAWGRMLDAAATRAIDAFVPAGANEGTRLLDTLRNRVVPAASWTELDGARARGQWDTGVVQWLATRRVSLRARAAEWLDAGKPDALGPIAATLSNATASGRATVTPHSFAGIAANAATLEGLGPFDWTTDAEEQLHLAGRFGMAPTALVAAAADARASAAVPGATDVNGALAIEVSCPGLATSLLAGGSAYAGCGEACFAAHCSAALGLLWRDARRASAGAADAVYLKVAASARARLLDSAEPASFAGTWVSEVVASVGTSVMKGTVAGVKK